jgi:hypothetical protein
MVGVSNEMKWPRFAESVQAFNRLKTGLQNAAKKNSYPLEHE